VLGPILLRGSSTPSWWPWSGVTAPAAGSRPFCFDYLSSGGRSSTTTSTYFHFDRSPLQEPVRAEGGSADDAGEVTSSFPCSRSGGITLRYVVFGSCVFFAESTCGTSNCYFFPWYSVGFLLVESFASSSCFLCTLLHAFCCICIALWDSAFCICTLALELFGWLDYVLDMLICLCTCFALIMLS